MTRQPNDQRIISALAIGFPLTARQLGTMLSVDISWMRRLVGKLHESGSIRITGTSPSKGGKPENIYSLTRQGAQKAKELAA